MGSHRCCRTNQRRLLGSRREPRQWRRSDRRRSSEATRVQQAGSVTEGLRRLRGRRFRRRDMALWWAPAIAKKQRFLNAHGTKMHGALEPGGVGATAAGDTVVADSLWRCLPAPAPASSASTRSASPPVAAAAARVTNTASITQLTCRRRQRNACSPQIESFFVPACCGSQNDEVTLVRTLAARDDELLTHLLLRHFPVHPVHSGCQVSPTRRPLRCTTRPAPPSTTATRSASASATNEGARPPARRSTT